MVYVVNRPHEITPRTALLSDAFVAPPSVVNLGDHNVRRGNGFGGSLLWPEHHASGQVVGFQLARRILRKPGRDVVDLGSLELDREADGHILDLWLRLWLWL